MKQLITGIFVLVITLTTHANNDWQDIVVKARGQTVYFNAWGGNQAVNDYIAWAGKQVAEHYGITVKHVQVNDISAVVKRVAAEVAAATKRDGSVDLVWINGENFSQMKQQGLLYGPWVGYLPNWKYVNQKLPVLVDFAVPTDGLESPWGTARFNFLVDSAITPDPPLSAEALLTFARKNPGKVTYPAPPEFHGTTLLKQLLLELAGAKWFQKPLDPRFEAYLTQPLWDYLDQLHPYLWKQGKVFPVSAVQMHPMLADGVLKLSVSFNPNEVENLIAKNELPKSTVSYGFSKGMIGNVHFVAIPVNAKSKEAAKVFANFLLSPKAQARKADIQIWGDSTVLDLQRLSVAQQQLFRQSGESQRIISVPTLAEPHSSWVKALEKEWQHRYGTD